MSKQLLTRGLVAVGLALVAVVLGLTQPMPAGARTDASSEAGSTGTASGRAPSGLLAAEGSAHHGGLQESRV